MLNYKAKITTTPETCVFLHRTYNDNLESIMRNGLFCVAGALQSTANLQSRDPELADDWYRNVRHKGDTAVVVIEIPREKWDIARAKAGGTEAMTRELGYFRVPTGFALRPEFVAGWIDRETDKFTENPYRNDVFPQAFIDESILL